MQRSDHLYYRSWGRQDADSGHETRRSRVSCKTVRSSVVTQKSSFCSECVKKARSRAARSVEVSVGNCAIVTDPMTDQAERTFERIIGNSAALESVLEQVEQVAPTNSTVLIEGETGTGKELIAHAIHNASQRCGRSFIKLNCAAIPLDLLESELFGHEKGAFTGAIAQKIGRFEMADKGTLFLDEVGDIPSALQP